RRLAAGAGQPASRRLAARRQVEVRRRVVRQLPADVGLLLLLVPGVGRVDRPVEGLLEGRPVLRLDRLLERRPVVAEVLLDRRLVLRPRVGTELEELLRLLPLV